MISLSDKRVMKMILEGKEFRLFNINIKALKYEGKLMIDYPLEGHTDEWASLMERLRDIIKKQGAEVPREEWLPFNALARKNGFNFPVVEFGFFFSIPEGGGYLFKIDSKYSPLAWTKPPIIEMVGRAKAFMHMEILSRC